MIWCNATIAGIPSKTDALYNMGWTKHILVLSWQSMQQMACVIYRCGDDQPSGVLGPSAL